MKISVAMIVQDDGKNIYRALNGCDFADEIVIVDGGSKDDTLLQIGRYTEEEGSRPVKLFHHQWPNHFAVQRNLSFSHCSGDWIIRLDSDELFGRMLRSCIVPMIGEIPDDVLSIRIRQNNVIELEPEVLYAANLGGWESHPRIFRTRKTDGSELRLSWQGQVHEWVQGVEHRCLDWNVCVNHFGWLDKNKLKEKENKYRSIPGSGFDTEGSLTDRYYEVRNIPVGVI